MKTTIRWCRPKDFPAVFYLNKLSNLFATARFMTSPSSIKRTLNSKKMFIVAEVEGKTVGYILGKMRTRGVCFNLLLTVDKPFRRRGIGGALIIAMLKLINQKSVNGVPNPYSSWKWYAEVPAYNSEALQMYKVLKFPVEGILRKHTSAKTDLYMIGFYLNETPVPEYGAHVHDPATITDDTLWSGFEHHVGTVHNVQKVQMKSKTLIDTFG